MCRHYYFFEKLKIVEKQLCKLNCSYGKVSHTLKIIFQCIQQTFLNLRLSQFGWYGRFLDLQMVNRIYQ